MEEMKPVVKEFYVVETRDKSTTKAFLCFLEYQLFDARIKVVGVSSEWSSRIAELSIGALTEEINCELTEIYELENCD